MMAKRLLFYYRRIATLTLLSAAATLSVVLPMIRNAWFRYHPYSMSPNAIDQATSNTERPLLFFQPLLSANDSCGCRCQHPQSVAEPEEFHILGNNVGFTGTPCILVFAAYFDNRDSTVKVIADTHFGCHQPSGIACSLWYQGYADSYESELTAEYITTSMPGETIRMGVVYKCMAYASVTEIPYAVSFHRNGAGERNCSIGAPKDLALAIGYSAVMEHKLVACVPPLFGKVSAYDVIAFVEMHRLLGIEKFYFYNDSVHDGLNSVLMQYIIDGVVQLIQWRTTYPETTLYHNQQIMQSDCMYRNLYSAKYVAQMDVDEVLLPRIDADLPELIAREETNDTAVLMFLNRFFSTDENVACSSTANITTQEKRTATCFRRLSYHNMFFGPTDRSKIIYLPRRLHQVHTHHAMPLEPYKTVVLSPTTATLNHYRSINYLFVTPAEKLADSFMCRYDDVLTRSTDLMLQRVTAGSYNNI